MDKEITIINKEKFCDIYNRINETVDLDEKYANAAERAPMNQKENLPVYTNCKGEKLVDLVGQNYGESADNGAIAALFNVFERFSASRATLREPSHIILSSTIL